MLRETLHVNLGAGAIHLALEEVTRDLLFLSSSQTLQETLHLTSTPAIERLEREFAAFSHSKTLYDQIRWIDETGMERVRVDYRGGDAVVLRGEDLQNKGDRYFYTDTIELLPGQIFISPFDLNIEHGQIEQPLKPMVRVATPLTDQAGNPRGILILNYFGRLLINSFDAAGAGVTDNIMLLNREGYFLRHPDPLMEWGFMYRRDDLALAAFNPVAWGKIRDNDHGQVHLDDGLWSWTTVYPLTIGQHTSTGAVEAKARSHGSIESDEYVWKVVAHIPETRLQAEVSTIAAKLVVITILLLTGSGFYCYLISRAWIRRDEAERHVRSINAGLEETVATRTDALHQKMVELDEINFELCKLSQAVEQSPAVVLITDTAGRIEYVNRRFSATTGYSVEDVVGKNPRIFKAEQTTVTNYEQLWATLNAGEPWHGEFLNKRKDGSLYWERAVISPMRDEQRNITHYLAIKEDITEQKQLEAQLLQAQKMESVGTLAGGVAHDFNNILSSITGFTWLALKKMEEGNPLRRNLEQVLAATDRAASLTKDLLLFSRKQPKQTRVFDLNELLTKTESLWRRTLDVDIRLVINQAPRPLSVVGDFHQLQQILMNLVINACDAIAGAGEINLETGQVNLKSTDLRLPGDCHPGEYARLKVRDNGAGMDQETLKHIFEPFYTTKSAEKGTGLGLAVVYGIVQQHKGFIRVDSQPGTGTCFCVYLPLSQEICLLQKPKQEETAPPEGSETILLAEDDDQGRRALTSILSEAGYRVITAVNGEDAVQHFMEDPENIDLLLFDLIMPLLNGKDAADAINKFRPGTRTLFISGYPSDNISINGADHILPKPINPRELLFKVREVLDG